MFSCHWIAETPPGALAKPIGVSVTPGSLGALGGLLGYLAARKKTVPSLEPVAKTFPSGENRTTVTFLLWGLKQSITLNPSEHRSRIRTTPSSNPATIVRCEPSTYAGAIWTKVHPAQNLWRYTSRFSAYAQSRTVPSEPAVTAWSLTAETSMPLTLPPWKLVRRVDSPISPSSPTATRTMPPFASCTSQWSGSVVMMLLTLQSPPAPSPMAASLIGSMSTSIWSSSGSASRTVA
mmetsp:Transcript_7418/g.32871  ORF Transcript_7418/g.32871 Transcript_7418/m.32871 type:complete len:235 (+) Transcript_7418:3926-4630(+)